MSRKINVCILSPGLPVPATQGGAIETLIEETSRHYRGTSAHIFSENVGADLDSDHFGPLPNVHYRQLKTPLPLWRFQKLLNRVARRGLFDLYDSFFVGEVTKKIDFEPDIFHLHNNFYYLPILKKRFPKAKIVLHMHNDFLFERPELHGQYDKVLKKADRVIAISKYVSGRISDFSQGSAERTRVIHNGVSLARFKKLPKDDPGLRQWRRRLGLTDEDRCLIFVGRIHPTKGTDVLVRAFQALRRPGEKLKLLIVGSSWFAGGKETPYVKKLRRLSESMRDSILFTGFVHHDQLNNLYNLAEVCAVPSMFQEACALVIIEAMAAGCAVIGSRRGGIPEMIQANQTGLIVEAGDAAALAGKIRCLLDHPEERGRLVQNARRHVEEHSDWSKIAEKYEGVYQELVG